MNNILESDLEYTYSHLSEKEKGKLANSTILITGCGGFLGQYHLSFFEYFFEKLALKKVIGIDTFLLGKSPLIKRLENDTRFEIRELDVVDFSKSDICSRYKIDYVLHMASIASPTYYRKHPISTIEGNILGLRELLESLKKNSIKGFLFYSSSEIYGNPTNEQVPTAEEYWGNVSCIGPRACYDESKRFGETICWVYHKTYCMPIKIVRLFNVYGPGLKMNDKRAPADFAKAIIFNKNIEIFSNGQPTRTFCYVADSVVGELKALLSEGFDVYNIGIEQPELTINQFAKLFDEIGRNKFNYSGTVAYATSDDTDYLTHDPQRRCPNINKARNTLEYMPSILPKEGVLRYLEYLSIEGEDAIW